MKRTTVFLEDKLLRQAQKHARQNGVSFAMVVREALSRYLIQPSEGTLPSIAGGFSSGMTDTSSHVDDLLWRRPRE